MCPAVAFDAALANDVVIAAVAVRTSTLTGTAIDLLAYDGLGRIRVHGVRTTGDLALSIEDSADGTTGFAAVPAGALSAALTAVTAGTDFLQSVAIDVSVVKRFIRLIGTASNTPSHTYGSTFTGWPKYRP